MAEDPTAAPAPEPRDTSLPPTEPQARERVPALVPRAGQRARAKSGLEMLINLALQSAEQGGSTALSLSVDPSVLLAALASPEFKKAEHLERQMLVERCGARRRDGGECRAKVVCDANGVPQSDRCKYHGGLSTGPQTAEGRAAIADSNRRRAAARRAQNEPKTDA